MFKVGAVVQPLLLLGLWVGLFVDFLRHRYKISGSRFAMNDGKINFGLFAS